ncbi:MULTISPECIES: HalOD1 output domain-containing protein [Natrialbaceae]|uniref:HalOD1 output domain-containing protein n=1 Tax=Natrialbaceae TaxID=1644061 RepID=UPI00207CF410|nr:HalOD1 output domain-containing protein [Natronococcus sp. CG52]
MSSAIDAATSRTTHLHHEWDGDEWASDRIVQAIAKCENESPRELPPLSNSIRPEALDTAFESDDGSVCRAGCITFSYYGYTVLVQSTGQILIKKN